MNRFACVINAICIGGMCVLFWSVGSPDTVTVPPVVKAPTVVLADGIWQQKNTEAYTACHWASLEVGGTETEVKAMVDACLIEMKVMI